MTWQTGVAVVASLAVAQGQGPRVLSVDDLMSLSAIVDVKISPDGERVAYVVSTPSVSRNEHVPALFVVPSSGGARRQVGESVRIFNLPSPAPRLQWSPDGTEVSVLAIVDGRPQVTAIAVADGATRTLTSASEGVFAYDWAPDGRSVAYLTRDPMPAEESRRRQERSFVVRADAPDRPTRLMVQLVARGAASQAPKAVSPVTHFVDSFGWAPDGREIAYAAAPRTGFTASYSARLYAVNLQDSTVRTIVDRDGLNTQPRYSPDGRTIAFISTGGRASIMAPRSLTVVPAAGGTPRIFGLDDGWVNEFVWARDSASIYLQANDGTFSRGAQMFEQPVIRVSVADGRAETVRGSGLVAFSLSLSGNGRRLAYKHVAARSTGEVEVLELANGRATTVSDINPQLRSAELGTLTPIAWRSFDGMEIWGLLLRPTNPAAGQRLPLLVYLHGGPNGGVTYGLFPQFAGGVPQVDPYPTATMVGEGYAVLFPMPRGGAGYGEAGQRMIVNAWGEADYRDLMAGVDRLVADGIADPDRLGVMGASYGGYMTNWIVTQTDRFKAASAGASISDIADLYYLSEGSAFIEEYFGRPWENAAAMAAHSPITFVERVRTPLLIQHGEVDPRVPVGGAWKFYRALKALGKTVELDVHPRGGHVLREPAQQHEQMTRNRDWFARWIPSR